jgi:hypothetical protein
MLEGMKGCYIYVLNPCNATCHRFHLEDDYPTEADVMTFLEDKEFRLKDIHWMFSQEEVIHERITGKLYEDLDIQT